MERAFPETPPCPISKSASPRKHAHEQLSTDTAQQAMKPFLTYTLDALNGYIQRNEGYIRELDTTRRTIKDVSKQIIERLKEQIK